MLETRIKSEGVHAILEVYVAKLAEHFETETIHINLLGRCAILERDLSIDAQCDGGIQRRLSLGRLCMFVQKCATQKRRKFY